MLVVMKNVASAEEIEAVVGVIQEMGYDARPHSGWAADRRGYHRQ